MKHPILPAKNVIYSHVSDTIINITTKFLSMKKITLLSVTLFCCGFIKLSAQQMDEASMTAWMDYSTPGDMQKMLAKGEGHWVSEITMWMSPDAQPMHMQAEVDNKMILDGRYLQGKNTGNFMGMPFEGWSITGYDNARKVFFNSWIDNMGTGIINLEGKWDAEKSAIVFAGMQTDPMTGKLVDVREIFTMIDNDNQKLEMYSTMDGKEFKTMEIIFKRQ